MKDASAFARKRKTRDKANLRWVKNRHLVLPFVGGAVLIGGLWGGTVAMSFGPQLTVHGVIVGAVGAFGLLGPAIINGLTK